MAHTETVATLLEQIAQSGEALRELLREVELHLDAQHQHAQACEDFAEMERLTAAAPYRWLEDAERFLRSGMMWAARAVEQPAAF